MCQFFSDLIGFYKIFLDVYTRTTTTLAIKNNQCNVQYFFFYIFPTLP